jgi:hypothetical protein
MHAEARTLQVPVVATSTTVDAVRLFADVLPTRAALCARMAVDTIGRHPHHHRDAGRAL